MRCATRQRRGKLTPLPTIVPLFSPLVQKSENNLSGPRCTSLHVGCHSDVAG